MRKINEKIIDSYLDIWGLKRKTPYINNRTKFEIGCPNGHSFFITYNNLLKRKKVECKECENLKKYTHFKETLEKEGYSVISSFDEWKNVATKLKVICSEGHSTELTYAHFLEGKRCKYCANNQKLSEDYISSQFLYHGYEILSKYKNASTPLKIKCPEGHITDTMTWANFKKGERCYICNKPKRVTYEFVEQELKKEGYSLLQNFFNGVLEGMRVKCPKGHITNTITWSNFKKGKRCKICNESKGEKLISNFLSERGINFLREYRFSDCKHKNKLPFDFYLPDLNICIEYDGEQHFYPVDVFGGESEFNEVKIRDSIKNNYCKDNEIKLIRIPYWDKERIREILTELIK